MTEQTGSPADAYLRALFDESPLLAHLPDLVLVADADGFVRLANRPTLDAHELPLLGRCWWTDFVPEQHPRARKLVGQAVETGAVQVGEFRDQRGRFWLCRLVPNIDAEPARLLIIACDVTAQRTAEQSLAEAGARMLSILQNLPDLIVVADPAGRIHFVNRLPPECNFTTLFAAPHYELVSPEFRDAYQQQCHGALAEGRPREIEVCSAGGQWWHCHFIPLDAYGEDQRLLILARDESARKTAVEALRRSEIRLRSISDAAVDAVLLLDAAGHVVHWNPAAERMFGYRRDDILGREAFGVLAPARHRRLLQTAFEEVMRGSAARQPGRLLELEACRRDGTTFPVEMSLSAAKFEPEGPRGAVAIVRDATERKRAEEALREREQRYRMLLRAVTSYTYSVWIERGVPIRTEHGPGCLATTGYGPEDFAANPHLWIEMVPAEERGLVLDFASRLLACQRVSPLEHRIYHRGGGIRWVRDTVVPHCEQGVLVRYDGLIEDITERKAAEAALRQREAGLLAAQHIQARLLPDGPQPLPGYDIAGAYRAADFTGGDYYDYLPLRDGCRGFVVGDVSGHGLGPALLMTLTYAHLRSLIETYDDLSEIMARTNRFLARETDTFVTLFLGALDPATRVFRYVSAGHPPGYVFDREGRVKAQLDSTAYPLGVDAEIAFPLGPIVQLEPGDIVLIVTDGIIEAVSATGEMFRIPRVLDLVAAVHDQPAREIIRQLYDAVTRFTGQEKLIDDMTAILVKVE